MRFAGLHAARVGQLRRGAERRHTGLEKCGENHDALSPELQAPKKLAGGTSIRTSLCVEPAVRLQVGGASLRRLSNMQEVCHHAFIKGYSLLPLAFMVRKLRSSIVHLPIKTTSS